MSIFEKQIDAKEIYDELLAKEITPQEAKEKIKELGLSKQDENRCFSIS